MATEHPITPPPELVQEWINEEDGLTAGHIATKAARWGADQELEACCQWLSIINGCKVEAEFLRSWRRPKPPSLKEQAKQAWLRFMDPDGHESAEQEADDYEIIGRALEALPDV